MGPRERFAKLPRHNSALACSSAPNGPSKTKGRAEASSIALLCCDWGERPSATIRLELQRWRWLLKSAPEAHLVSRWRACTSALKHPGGRLSQYQQFHGRRSDVGRCAKARGGLVVDNSKAHIAFTKSDRAL